MSKEMTITGLIENELCDYCGYLLPNHEDRCIYNPENIKPWSKEITAMQVMINSIEKMITIKTFQQWDGLKMPMLELEKQQIIIAHDSGEFLSYSDGLDYYNQTFKTDTNE